MDKWKNIVTTNYFVKATTDGPFLVKVVNHMPLGFFVVWRQKISCPNSKRPSLHLSAVMGGNEREHHRLLPAGGSAPWRELGFYYSGVVVCSIGLLPHNITTKTISPPSDGDAVRLQFIVQTHMPQCVGTFIAVSPTPLGSHNKINCFMVSCDTAFVLYPLFQLAQDCLCFLAPEQMQFLAQFLPILNGDNYTNI